MKTIRYSKMVIGGSNQCSTLILSSCESHQSNEMYTTQLAELMLKKSKNWIIDGEEVLDQVTSLYELLKELKKGNSQEVFIHLKTKHYDYWFMRGISVTDSILDMCDVLTDKHNNSLDLRATCSINDPVYWEVS
ncbi:hypothetical protein IJE86_07620 [bacterium]|nr:hypothetical protein [bacterium]